MGLVGGILLLCIISITLGETKDVKRIYYGVVFKDEGLVSFSPDFWAHTVKIALPSMITWNKIPYCKYSSNLDCSADEHLAREINLLRKVVLEELKFTMTTIFELIPEMNDDRSKRAPLSFLTESIGKGIFGIATENDVKVLARHINILTSEFNRMSNQYARDQGDFASVLHQVDDRLNQVTRFMTETRHITDSVIQAMSDVQTRWVMLEELILNQTELAAEIRSRLNKLSVAITTLVHGSIPPFLVEPRQMSQIITLISEELKREHPSYKLAITDPRFYYGYEKFMYARKETNLFLTIKFPLTAHVKYQLYKVKTFYVPLNETSLDATILINQPKYYLVSEQEGLMTTASQNFIDRCGKGPIKVCTETMTFSDVSQPTCLSEIYYENNVSLIHKLCDYRYLSKVVTPHILEISPTEILLYRVEQLSMTCHGRQVNASGCSFCHKIIGCQCSLTNDLLSYTGHISFCNDNDTEIETYYPINIGVLANFFNHKYLTTLMRNVSFQDPIKVLIPQFKVYEHEVSRMVADDKKRHLSMKKLAERAKKNKVVYSNLADMIADGEIEIEDGLSTFNILTIISFGSCILHTLVLIYVWYKLRLITSAILIMGKAHASGISIVYTTTTTPSPFDLFSELKKNWQIEHWIISLQIIIILLAITILIRIVMMRDKNQTFLNLHISDGLRCCDINLIRITTCSSEWQFDIPSNINNLRIKWSLKPKLCIEWSDFKVINKITGQHLMVPKIIDLTMLDAVSLYKILKGHFSTYVYLNDRGVKVPVGSNAVSSRELCLYPSLSYN